MKISEKIFTRQSIGIQLLKKVFLLYIVCAVLLTSIHMYMEYRRVKTELLSDLGVLYQVFGEPLAIAVWDADSEQLLSLIDGLEASHLISGVSVYEADGGHIHKKGNVIKHGPITTANGQSGVRLEGLVSGKSIFGYQYPLNYSENGNPNLLGHVDIYASEEVVVNKLKYQFAYILIAALVKACVLWMVFLWYSNRMLTRPLTNFAAKASEISMDRLVPVSLDLGSSERNEIDILQLAFNEMVSNLKSGVIRQRELYEKLDKLRQNLQIEVDERTEDLRTTNIDLIRQIHDRQEAELKVNRYSRILEESLNEIYVFDCKNLQFLFANDGACKNLGYSHAEILSLSPLDIKPDFEKETFLKMLTPLTSGEQQIVVFETRLQRKNRSVYSAEVHVQQMEFPEGDVFVAMILDISEKRLLEDKLRQSQKMESIGTLAGGIAHDFNNILSAILGFTELAREDAPKGSEQEENLAEVFSAGNRAKELVKQILAFARQSDESVKPVRFGNLIEDVLKLLRPSTPATIEVIAEIECNSPVMGNSTQLHQVVLNLCTNAIHSMQQAGGVLTLGLQDKIYVKNLHGVDHLKSSKKYVELTVTDTGLGIDAAILNNIFEPYFTTKDVGEGSGMGLAMVKGIVETYGGDVYASSTAGETVFTVHLPISSTQNHELDEEEAAVESGSERLLFVDDELPIARMASRQLEGLGYTVSVMTNSVEALKLFTNDPENFDLVITDMTMPSLTGGELAVKMREIRPDIPVIICTGYSSNMSETEAQDLGINAFAYKPFTKADFARTIRSVLDSL